MSWSFPRKRGENGKLDSALQQKRKLTVWSTLTFLPIDFEGWATLQIKLRSAIQASSRKERGFGCYRLR
jgi:hypothetical protein